MKNQFSTEAAIEDLVNAHCSENASAREKHIYREALRGLVRLALSEQLMEMRLNVSKAAGVTQLCALDKPMASGEAVHGTRVA